MAARKTKFDPQYIRDKIQTSQLINRLTDHVNGKVKLDASQVTAALGLLRKTTPDLSAMEHSGEVTRYVVRVPEAAQKAEDWASEHGSPTLQ
jgi:hypothetical protein